MNTWAEKCKFKTAAELEKDANALAKSSPTKFGKGLNSRFHESTYTIQSRASGIDGLSADSKR